VLAAARFVASRRAGERGPPWPPARRWGALALAALLVLACITLVYGGTFSRWTDESGRYSQALSYLFGARGPLHDLAYAVAARVPLPDGLRLLVGGIQAVAVHNTAGHESYLLGEVRYGGWWYFYIVALVVKTPLPLLVLGLAGLVQLFRDGWRRSHSWEVAPAALFVALLAFCSVFSHINIGVRHVLMLYPLLALGAARATLGLYEAVRVLRLPALRLTGGALLAAVFAWQVLVPLRAWPDYLAYFNETVAEPRRVLVDSDLDWGQDLRRLEERLAELHVPRVSLGYRGSARLAAERLPPYRLIGPEERTAGWIAVSALARVSEPGAYAWLDAYAPVEHVGRTIDLYHLAPQAAARR